MPASTWHPASDFAGRGPAPIADRQRVERFFGVLVILRSAKRRRARQLIGERKRPRPIGGEIGPALAMRDHRADAAATRVRARARGVRNRARAVHGRRRRRLDHHAPREQRGLLGLRRARDATSRMASAMRSATLDPARRVTRFGQVVSAKSRCAASKSRFSSSASAMSSRAPRRNRALVSDRARARERRLRRVPREAASAPHRTVA